MKNATGHSPLVTNSEDGARCTLTSPTAMPAARAFLWNRRMLLQVNCRGFVVARHMQPEPAAYAHAPNLEAKTFMQPEQPFYAHHPGRFLYVKDEDNGALFSCPYEPVRARADQFAFSVGADEITWRLRQAGLEITMTLRVPVDDAVELWECTLRNHSPGPRRISAYPYFPVGYMSWMNQSGEYRADLGGIVCSSITPYQKVDDYFKNQHLKDKTFLLHETTPDAWEAAQSIFEGEGGLHNPDGVRQPLLGGGDARYQVPTAALQYQLQLAPGEERTLRFLFGPARDDEEMFALRERYLSATGFATAADEYQKYLAQGRGCLQIETPDRALDAFANHWLPRQVFYHGDVNRLTTDPQTRNYLQDQLGMAYIRPQTARSALLRTLSQQKADGSLPDGILLSPEAELKYINQVPHTDHCVWLPIFLRGYLDETGDHALLDERVIPEGEDKVDGKGHGRSVFECVSRAMDWLAAARDDRGLSYIGQGDWCDPMNMVGYRGRGVSGWLSLATAYALKLWAEICRQQNQLGPAEKYVRVAAELNSTVNRHLWDGDWFARGITDDGKIFGVSEDQEGRIFLNPQSWALLSVAADDNQRKRLLRAVEQQLATPFGPMMLAPAYTGMREDVGRVTQKFPGSAENGSVYNHAAAFYIYSLFTIGESDRAWRLLRQMLPGPDREDLVQRGQLPVFIPNYYRGAWYQYPAHAGRSSQLLHTGTAAWIYRCLIEELFGLKGEGEGLRIAPQLPSHWPQAQVQRRFRGAVFDVQFERCVRGDGLQVYVDGEPLAEPLISPVEAGRVYHLRVLLPPVESSAPTETMKEERNTENTHPA
ncbi:GH36-type glycosyl hydrolase domain-containing protein [Microbulbifer elongatus]|uniref:GH36-type glycosyl hydrolase domain-containing protein n=1 Tax=Microbulbifer elongatus TaxID=86173 RepID=UPI001E409359|nr:NdvB protein [Microbulbifer elongatus]